MSRDRIRERQKWMDLHPNPPLPFPSLSLFPRNGSRRREKWMPFLPLFSNFPSSLSFSPPSLLSASHLQRQILFFFSVFCPIPRAVTAIAVSCKNLLFNNNLVILLVFGWHFAQFKSKFRTMLFFRHSTYTSLKDFAVCI